ncbi:MAG TPA: peptide deformylase [Legionellales bacterium]|nr:peptide deformylase [Legionellales bacterium]
MTIRTILYLPDERLRRVSAPVKVFDNDLQILIDDMFETMYDAKGVGLAAPQIGINLRLSVMDISGDKTDQIVLINPVILEQIGVETFQEGCLSVPSAYYAVKRAHKIRVQAYDRHNQLFERTGEGLFAECLQHEIDHLDGKLFIDLLSPLKRDMARRKLEKFKRSRL